MQTGHPDPGSRIRSNCRCLREQLHLVVIAAPETATNFGGFVPTDAMGRIEADAAEPFDPIELQQRSLLTVPGGWRMSPV